MGAAASSGSAAATSSAWSATRPRRSTPSPAPTRATCATSAPSSPARRRSSWSATTARPPRSSRRPTRLLAASTSRGVDLRAQRPSGPDGQLHRAPRRGGRGRRGRRPDRPAPRRRPLAGRGRDAVPHQRPVRVLRGGALRSRRPVRRARRGALLRPPRGARGGHPAARRRPLRRGCGRRRRPGRHRRSSAAWAGRPSRPPVAARPGTAGSPGRRWSTRRPSSPAPRSTAPCPTSTPSSTSSTGAPPSSTRRSPTASPWRPSTPPRAWSGTRSSSCGLQDGTLPITYADTPAAIEEERRLLYVGMTRARVDLSLSWSLARNPGGRALAQAVAVPRPAAARLGPGHERAAAQPQGRQLPGVRPAAVHGRREEARPLRGLPGVVRRGAVREAPRVAQGAGRRGGQAGVRRLHRRHPAADRRAQAADLRGAAEDQRHRPVEGREVRRGRPHPGRLRPGRTGSHGDRTWQKLFEKWAVNRLPLTWTTR